MGETSYLKKEGLQASSTIAVTRAFYEEYGQPLIHTEFPEYEDRIAVGLVGEGSECFGFDDEISRDHDFDLGFCMWLTAEDYERIGKDLDAAYHRLIAEEGVRYASSVWGEQKTLTNQRIESRRGVMDIAGFYGNTLRLSPDLSLLVDRQYWVYAEPRWLATAVNGEVFRDDLGTFTSIRDMIKGYYPQRFYLYKLAEQLHLFSHGGQSNYPRMMARRDPVAARLCIDQTIRAAMDIAYLLAKEYPPYYKWTFQGLLRLPILHGLPALLEKLTRIPGQDEIWENLEYSPLKVYTEDPVIRTIEEIAGELVREMNRQDLIEGEECFLESYVPILTAKADNC
ncbi:MAG: DUF4037 domain-containing protein [Blautia sp.]|nr:DUF4037 domain-containing protein [Blautia sp.]